MNPPHLLDVMNGVAAMSAHTQEGDLTYQLGIKLGHLQHRAQQHSRSGQKTEEYGAEERPGDHPGELKVIVLYEGKTNTRDY